MSNPQTNSSNQSTDQSAVSVKKPSSEHSLIDISNATAARLAILFYVLLAILSPLGILLPPTWIDEGDPAETVKSIQDNETLFRVAIILNLFGQICFLLAGIAFYKLFKDIDKFQATLLLAFVAVSVPMTMGLDVFRLGALYLVGDAEYLTHLDQTDLNGQVVLMMTLYGLGIHIVELFWGLWLLPLGYLFYKSEYIPRILGVLLIINGVSYVLEVVNSIVFEQENEILTNLLILGEAVGELPTILWLLVMGIKLPERRVRLLR